MLVFEGECPEYKGFIREILFLKNSLILINISKEYLNEKGWNFSKTYNNYDEAKSSLDSYLNLIKTLEKIENETYSEVVKRLNKDILRKKIILPDNGKGYKYH